MDVESTLNSYIWNHCIPCVSYVGPHCNFSWTRIQPLWKCAQSRRGGAPIWKKIGRWCHFSFSHILLVEKQLLKVLQQAIIQIMGESTFLSPPMFIYSIRKSNQERVNLLCRFHFKKLKKPQISPVDLDFKDSDQLWPRENICRGKNCPFTFWNVSEMQEE